MTRQKSFAIPLGRKALAALTLAAVLGFPLPAMAEEGQAAAADPGASSSAIMMTTSGDKGSSGSVEDLQVFDDSVTNGLPEGNNGSDGSEGADVQMHTMDVGGAGAVTPAATTTYTITYQKWNKDTQAYEDVTDEENDAPERAGDVGAVKTFVPENAGADDSYSSSLIDSAQAYLTRYPGYYVDSDSSILTITLSADAGSNKLIVSYLPNVAARIVYQKCDSDGIVQSSEQGTVTTTGGVGSVITADAIDANYATHFQSDGYRPDSSSVPSITLRKVADGDFNDLIVKYFPYNNLKLQYDVMEGNAAVGVATQTGLTWDSPISVSNSAITWPEAGPYGKSHGKAGYTVGYYYYPASVTPVTGGYTYTFSSDNEYQLNNTQLTVGELAKLLGFGTDGLTLEDGATLKVFATFRQRTDYSVYYDLSVVEAEDPTQKTPDARTLVPWTSKDIEPQWSATISAPSRAIVWTYTDKDTNTVKTIVPGTTSFSDVYTALYGSDAAYDSITLKAAYGSITKASDISITAIGASIDESASKTILWNDSTAVTADDKTAGANGSAISFTLAATTDGDATAIKDTIAKSDEGYEFGSYLNVTLKKTVGNKTTDVTKIANPLTVTVNVPDSLKTYGSGLKVYRLHDDTLDLLDATYSDGELTFSTNLFSDYAIAYKRESNGNSDNGSSKDNGSTDNGGTNSEDSGSKNNGTNNGSGSNNNNSDNNSGSDSGTSASNGSSTANTESGTKAAAIKASASTDSGAVFAPAVDNTAETSKDPLPQTSDLAISVIAILAYGAMTVLMGNVLRLKRPKTGSTTR